MDKPISILRADFINDFRSLINNSNLSPYIIEPILDKALQDLRVLIAQQYEQDLKEYKKSEDNEK